jgi:hypothetical protein
MLIPRVEPFLCPGITAVSCPTIDCGDGGWVYRQRPMGIHERRMLCDGVFSVEHARADAIVRRL